MVNHPNRKKAHWTHDKALLQRAEGAECAAENQYIQDHAPMGPGDGSWYAGKYTAMKAAGRIAYYTTIRAAGWDVRGSGGE
jgi:hypothetical protein